MFGEIGQGRKGRRPSAPSVPKWKKEVYSALQQGQGRGDIADDRGYFLGPRTVGYCIVPLSRDFESKRKWILRQLPYIKILEENLLDSWTPGLESRNEYKVNRKS